MIYFISGALFGIGLVWAFIRRKDNNTEDMTDAQIEKEKRKKKILTLFKDESRIKNSDVRDLLDVSDATVTRYLDELEEEGEIVQHGDRKSAYYVRLRK